MNNVFWIGLGVVFILLNLSAVVITLVWRSWATPIVIPMAIFPLLGIFILSYLAFLLIPFTSLGAFVLSIATRGSAAQARANSRAGKREHIAQIEADFQAGKIDRNEYQAQLDAANGKAAAY